jgi:CPA1 family monovalent cation:H+ antiporter
MTPTGTLVLLFSIATAVAIATRRIPIPYTVALLIAGLGLGVLGVIEAPHLTKDVLFIVFLPGLLFEGAFHIDLKDFRRNSLTITALALPGVVASIGLTAVVVAGAFRAFGLHDDFTLRHGLVLGALLAATDPIAVIGLFRTLHAPKRLELLVEGESLFNDGTAIVFLTLVLQFVQGRDVSIPGLALSFVLIAGGGALIGAVIGMAAAQVAKRIDDAMIQITLTVITAYGSFALADSLQLSGVIATVTAGMICGSVSRRASLSQQTHATLVAFWEYVAFALNSFVFLLMGFAVIPLALFAAWKETGIAYLAVTVARFGIIFVVVGLLSRTEERVPKNWKWPLSWGGLRGALSMVLALSLPADFPQRNLLIAMTFGVVVLSILVQGLTIASMLRRLNIREEVSFNQSGV